MITWRARALAEAIADLRQIQQRTAQATAAKTAAERLRAAASPHTATPPRGPDHTRPRTAAGLADTSFPVPNTPQDHASRAEPANISTARCQPTAQPGASLLGGGLTVLFG